VLGYAYHPEAEAEYQAAIRYHHQISTDLATAFVAEVENAVQRARTFPESFRKIRGDLRRVLTRRFSYGIIFEVIEGRIIIWAVAHTSRKPGYWKPRLA
jgi:toxin ParE1/3/4